MHTLFIDLASHSTEPGQGACMACVSGEATIAIQFIDHRIGDDGLMPVFDKVLKEAECAPTDLTRIACIVGPGGFTSLRMAVSLANALADQLKIPAASIHLSDLYAARVTPLVPSPSPQPFFWIHATKKEALFIKGFGEFADQWPESTLVTLDELAEQLPDHAPVAGEILPEQRARLASKTMIDIPLQAMEDALPGLLAAQEYDQSLLTPWYGRGW